MIHKVEDDIQPVVDKESSYLLTGMRLVFYPKKDEKFASFENCKRKKDEEIAIDGPVMDGCNTLIKSETSRWLRAIPESDM